MLGDLVSDEFGPPSEHLADVEGGGRWPELVGDQVAQHATPVDFSPPLLVNAADSTTWATQLRVLKPTILRRLEEGLGSRTITEIEIRGPQGRSFKRGRRSVPGRGPRDTFG